MSKSAEALRYVGTERTLPDGTVILAITRHDFDLAIAQARVEVADGMHAENCRCCLKRPSEISAEGWPDEKHIMRHYGCAQRIDDHPFTDPRCTAARDRLRAERDRLEAKS